MSDALAENSPVITLRAKNRGSPHLPAKAGSAAPAIAAAIDLGQCNQPISGIDSHQVQQSS